MTVVPSIVRGPGRAGVDVLCNLGMAILAMHDAGDSGTCCSCHCQVELGEEGQWWIGCKIEPRHGICGHEMRMEMSGVAVQSQSHRRNQTIQ